MNELIVDWMRANQELALVVIPLIAFLEAFVGIGFFVSGVILLTLSTVMYSEQIASLEQILPLAFLGALLSDHSGFYLGRWIGPRFHESGFAKRHKERLVKTETLLRRFGVFAIIFGRLMTAIRSLVPLLTGISGMDRVRYTVIDLFACSVWTAGLGLLVVGLDRFIESF